MAAIEITPVEMLALKKLALINGALAQSLKDAGARREQTALLQVLIDVVARADLANETERARREEPCLTDAEQKAQGARCGCRGADDYCVCQNVPDATTRAARGANG